PVFEQCVHWSWVLFGGTSVLNRVNAIAPCAQFWPRWVSMLWFPVSHARVHVLIAWTSSVGSLEASSRSAPVGNPPTEFIPMFFCFLFWLVFPTSASENATVFDVPSTQLFSPYDFWKANRPELSVFFRVATSVAPVTA